MLFKQQRRIFSLHRIARRIRWHAERPVVTRPSRKRASAEARINRSRVLHGDLYQFGVYTGGGLKAWLDGLPALNISFSGQVWGFDSFIGMPEEANASAYQTPAHLKNPAWQPGGLNATAMMGASDWPNLRATLLGNVGHTEHRTDLIRGFYNESLVDGSAFARRMGMRPAFLIDIDCDLYSSSKQALEFMLQTGLLAPGTFVYYDDVTDYTYQAVQKKHVAPMEELLAHEQLTVEWGLRWKQLPSLGGFPGPVDALRWIPQFAPETKGRIVPPEMYPPVVELQSCRRCGSVQ